MSSAADALLRTFAYQDGLVLAVAAAYDDAPQAGGCVDAAMTGTPPVRGYRLAARQALRAITDAGSQEDHRALLDGLHRSRTLLTQSLVGTQWSDYEQVAEAAAEALLAMPSPRDADTWSSAALAGPAASVMLPRLPPLNSFAAILNSGAVARALQRLGLSDAGECTSLGHALTFMQPMLGLAGSYAAPLLQLPEDTTMTPRMVVAQMDRRLNVIASGHAHRGYFKAAGPILRCIFDNPNLDRQPKAVVDIGCGDGSLLREIDTFVRTRTRRGATMDQYPLLLIGVDVDPRALEVARDCLKHHTAVCLLGDIGQPDTLIDAIQRATSLVPDDVLHVRAFVDHNRTLPSALEDDSVEPHSDQVFIHLDGQVVPQAQVARDWRAHMHAWRKACGHHGIMLFEGHTLSPGERSIRRGSTHATAFAFYHSVSAQGPIPYPQFVQTLHDTGFMVDDHSSRFPSTGHATASLSWIRPKP